MGLYNGKIINEPPESIAGAHGPLTNVWCVRAIMQHHEFRCFVCYAASAIFCLVIDLNLSFSMFTTLRVSGEG